MDAPQSRADIDPIELAVRQIDDALRIRWNPRSYVTRPGSFDAYGNPQPPAYEGRWEVVRAIEGRLTVIYQVRWDGEGNEAYRPVGWWLVDFLRLWDRENVHWMQEQQRMLEEEDALVRAHAEADDQALGEQLNAWGVELGMKQWIGRGFGQGVKSTR